MRGSPFVRGTVLLTMATIISKLLGFIYIIPFTAMVGTSGYVLYTYAYRPYTMMLSIATMGLPLAVSKMISKYNQLQDYETVYRILRSAIVFLLCMGIVACASLYALAPILAHLVIREGNGAGNSVEMVIWNIRIVSLALLLVPVMSLWRGFFQGFQSMGPSAISVVVEQILRVVTILIGTFVALRLYGVTSIAVGVATFGAFIGACGGLFVLLFFYIKRRKNIFQARKKGAKQGLSLRHIYKELFTYSIPFIIVGLAIPIYQTIDTFTLNALLIDIGYELREAEKINAIIGLVQMIILIPVSLATAMSTSLIPEMTKAFTARDWKVLYKHFVNTNMAVATITFPAVLIIIACAEPLYTLLFGKGNDPLLGGIMLRYYAPMCVLFSLFSVTAAMLQGINEQRKTIIGLLFGIAIKYIGNILLIPTFDYVGAIIATYSGYTFSVLFNLWLLSRCIGKNIKKKSRV